MDFFKIVYHGKFYYPASLHYNNEFSNIVCDKCHRNNLKVCIGWEKFDICIQCAHQIMFDYTGIRYNPDIKIDDYKPIPRQPLTLMMEDRYKINTDRYLTRMAQDMYKINDYNYKPILTFMLQDMYKYNNINNNINNYYNFNYNNLDDWLVNSTYDNIKNFIDFYITIKKRMNYIEDK